MTKRKIVAVFGVLAMAACASLDGLSNGGVGETQADAAVDAGAVSDGSASSSPFCVTQPDAWLCETFDDRPLPGAFGEQTALGSSVRLDETEFASPSRSLAVDVPKETSSTDHAGTVGGVLPPSTRIVTFEVKTKALKVPTPFNDGPRADVLWVSCGNEADVALYSVLVEMRPTDAGADVWLTSFTPATNGVRYLSAFSAADVVGAWGHFRMTTDWTKMSVELRSVTDSGTVLIGDGTLQPPSGLTIPPPWCHFEIGVHTNNQHDGWSVRFDDVAIHRE